MRNFTIYLFAFLYLLLSTVTNAATTSNNPSADKLLDLGFKRSCEKEPIFYGDACIYQANVSARKTVILVHGINGQAANWIYQLKELKKHFHVLTFDLPGFGRSTQSNELYSPTNYAKFLHVIANKYAKKPFHLMGHSLGGAIVLRYNSLHPNNVDRLITVDTAGILHRYAFTKSIAFKWLGIFEKISYLVGPGFQDFAVNLLQSLEDLPIDIKQALKIPALREVILKGNSLPIAGAALVNEDFSGAIFNNKTPTLIVWGSYDMISPIRTGQFLRSNMNTAYLKILPNSAHSSMSDEPVAFNKLMMSHLTQKTSTLTRLYWKKPTYATPKKVGICNHEDNMSFEGSYKSIDINTCKNVRLSSVYTTELIIKNSSISLTDSVIESEATGIIATSSDVEITNVDFNTKLAIQSDNSNFDIAGSSFNNPSNNIKSLSNTTVVFSISRTPTKTLHEFIKLTTDDTF